ncbi:hypothetical protein LXA47_00045 [Massilia sp. P8910]|uniref:hypothetical protein n=1 Tax=Massilia antarctica TaxID=2765360 RepID=UPI001E5DF302|nr:hypothetical protein [Massilia antarctica]MCE3602005.1 hypothetical protein [Massilia antarctica]
MKPVQQVLPAGLIAATLLTGCGGGGGDGGKPGPTPAPDPVARVDLLMSHERGMNAISIDDKNAYVALTNTETEATSVLATARGVSAKSVWQNLALGECKLPPSSQVEVRRAAELKQVDGKTLLMQPAWGSADEHTLCELDPVKMSFVPKDKDFRICYATYCERMQVADVKAVGRRWFANGGAGQNLQISNDQGLTWRPIMGTMDSMSCTHQSFEVVGGLLLTGGECPLDMAYVRAYAMNADNSGLASKVPVQISVPELENRNVHLITTLGKSERVFIGVEGGLLRSDDSGKSYKFVLKQALSGGANYPYITRLLSPAGKPNVIVAAGFDKAHGLPYLAWSNDNGDKWTDLSTLLPGYKRTVAGATSQVTSIAEDTQGRILVTVNEEFKKKGRLVEVKLGRL